MPGFDRPSARRRRRGSRPRPTGTAGKPAIFWYSLAALALLLTAVPILLFNQQHSGDRLKIQRELRKF
jgi:hypothetical protein